MLKTVENMLVEEIAEKTLEAANPTQASLWVEQKIETLLQDSGFDADSSQKEVENAYRILYFLLDNLIDWQITHNASKKPGEKENLLSILIEELRDIVTVLWINGMKTSIKHASTTRRKLEKLRNIEDSKEYVETWKEERAHGRILILEKLQKTVETWCIKEAEQTQRQTHYMLLAEHVGEETGNFQNKAKVLVGKTGQGRNIVETTDINIGAVYKLSKRRNTQSIIILPQNAAEILCNGDRELTNFVETDPKILENSADVLKTALKLYEENPDTGFENCVKISRHIEESEFHRFKEHSKLLQVRI